MMKCFLCQSNVEFASGTGECKRVKCSRCGEYQISKAALEVLRTSPEMHYQVDVSAQRSWLNQKRRLATTTPTIGSRELKLVRRQRSSYKAS